MNTYTIRLKRKLWFDKKLRNVKGNLFPDDMNPASRSIMTERDGKAEPLTLRETPVRFMLVIFADERRLIVNLDKYQGYELSKELFLVKARQAEAQSQGLAKVGD